MLKGIVRNINSIDDLIKFLPTYKGDVDLLRKDDIIELILSEKSELENQPYIYKINITIEEQRFYNKLYGDEKVCECGHTYEKHFDSYDDNYPVGCKYCDCVNFVEKKDDSND